LKENYIDWTCSMHGEMRNSKNCLVRNLKRRNPLLDLDVNGRIILKTIFDKQIVSVWTELNRLKTECSDGLWEHAKNIYLWRFRLRSYNV
jgi:hypothetical protein